MTDDIGFIAKHPEADMSNVNRIIINGKVYLAADKILEIIHKLDVENMGFFLIGRMNTMRLARILERRLKH